MTGRDDDFGDDLSRQPPAALGEVLAGLVARRGWDRRLEGARIHARWDEIAGEQLARHTEPVRLVGGVLVLRADSGAWATQLSYLSPQLAARANAVLGDEQVVTVRVVTGRLQGPGSSHDEGV